MAKTTQQIYEKFLDFSFIHSFFSLAVVDKNNRFGGESKTKVWLPNLLTKKTPKASTYFRWHAKPA
jgi:hypothetical protein